MQRIFSCLICIEEGGKAQFNSWDCKSSQSILSIFGFVVFFSMRMRNDKKIESIFEYFTNIKQ
jgi:hypothetical protein